MKAEVRAGLDRVGSLVPGTGYLELTAGVSKPWDDALSAFARAEAGWKPRENVDLFGFAQVDTQNGAQAGVGARLTW